MGKPVRGRGPARSGPPGHELFAETRPSAPAGRNGNVSRTLMGPFDNPGTSLVMAGPALSRGHQGRSLRPAVG